MEDDDELSRLLEEFGIRAVRRGDPDAPPSFDDLGELGSDDWLPPMGDDDEQD